ncbi:hypothetical protein ACIQGZ_17470 [Streptomyces sp. NPDC092296]|uniref:hypothetical protein n=1 Tax=Streptomyces sp. NPDC092296 TaxID=3366012 RepID=UPI003802E359
MTPAQRGDLAEKLLPIAAHLACLTHGNGDQRDIHQTIARLTRDERDALIVILAALVDPDQSIADALGYVTWDEHGRTAPAIGWRGTLRHLASRRWWPTAGGVEEILVAEQKHRARVLHERRGMTLVETARRVGVNERTVLRWKQAGWGEAA